MRRSPIPRRFRHVPLLWWLAAVALAVTAGIAVTQSVARAEASAARYDRVVTVFVANRSLEPGTVISADDVQADQRPSAFLPASDPVADPIGTIANVSIDEGEVITEAKVGAAGLSPTVALLREGEQGVSIATAASTPAVQLGDPVDVLATFTTEGATSEPTIRVATDARVIAVSETAITVAVDETESARVAFASARGVVTLALTRPGPSVAPAETLDE